MSEKFKFSKKGIKCPGCPSSDAFFPYRENWKRRNKIRKQEMFFLRSIFHK